MNTNVSGVRRRGSTGASIVVAMVVCCAACSFDSGGISGAEIGVTDLGFDQSTPDDSGDEGGVELGLDQGGDADAAGELGPEDQGAELPVDQGSDVRDVGVLDGSSEAGADGSSEAGADGSSEAGADGSSDAGADGSDAATDLSPDLGGPQLPPLGVGGGRLVFGSASVADPSQLYTFAAAGPSLALEAARPVVAEPYWIRYAVVGGQETMAVEHRVASKTTLTVLRWDGASWAAGPTRTEPNGVDLNKRDIALATESSSGDALLVYGGQQNAPLFATFTNGAWSALSPITGVSGLSDKVLWAELVAAPTGDEVVLLVADKAWRLLALTWDGAAWVPGSFTVVATDLKRNGASGTLSNRPFDVAFEQTSGELLVVWGRNSATGIGYRLRAKSGSWQSAQSLGQALAGGEVHHVDLAADPSSDRIAAGLFDLGDGTERLGLGVWDGTAWQDSGEVDSQIRDFNDGSRGDFPGAVAWLGSSGRAVCLYSNDSPKLAWWEWQSASGWTSKGGIALPGDNAVESVQIRGGGGDKALSLVSDANSQLFALYYDGASWAVLTTFSSPISRKDARPFDILFP